MKEIVLLFHDDCYLHKIGAHPESPRRLDAALSGAEKSGVPFSLIKPQEFKETHIELVHTPNYIEYIKEACKKAPFYLDPDTGVCAHTYKAAIAAVSCAITAADMVLSGEFLKAFAIIRPPGHHAKRESAAGFCYFNNMAVMVKYIMKEHSIKRVLIVDFDAHAGDGTMHIFYDDPFVFFFSVHQDPSFFYPGEGFLWQRGRGEGEGKTVNFPLSPHSGDADYACVMDVVKEISSFFLPQIICVSAGFDAHRKDHISALDVTEDGFYMIAYTLCEIAEKVCGGRLIFLLEGGYNLEALSDSVGSVFEAMCKKKKPLSFGSPSSQTVQTAKKIMEALEIERKG